MPSHRRVHRPVARRLAAATSTWLLGASLIAACTDGAIDGGRAGEGPGGGGAGGSGAPPPVTPPPTPGSGGSVGSSSGGSSGGAGASTGTPGVGGSGPSASSGGSGPTPNPNPEPEPGPTPPPGPVGQPLPAPVVRASEAEFPVGVRDILERRCTACHTYGERDPAGWGSAIDLSRMIASDIVVPGEPDASRLINRVAVRADMPYNGTRLSSPEVQTLRAWIANLPRKLAPTPRTQRELLDLLATDQNSQRNTGNDLRYLSFNHFLDEGRGPEELAAAEAVLNVVVNSLSRRATLVKLEPVDQQRTIFRFRLSALGWGTREWNELVSFYPYCVRSDQASHRTLYQRLGTESPYLRADWFLATATKPPLYHTLLDLPNTLQALTDDLDLDIEDNINHQGEARPSDVMRIGFRSSGVSAHNRIIERHQLGGNGYFWLSYDFNDDQGTSDIRENPLGPASANQRNFQNIFSHAGGEVIYSLPNGMMAFLLVDAAGNRLDTAPKDIVRDPRRRAGAVENGISCISCHGVTGMNHPRAYDEIRTYAEEHRNEFSNAELNEIRNLYPAGGAGILNMDANRYLAAKDAVGGGRAPFGAVEYDDFINLVGQYEGEVGLHGAAVELGITLAATRSLVQSGRVEDALPLDLAAPLVTRDRFACQFRELTTRAVRNAQFCAGSFTAEQARAVCE